MKNFQSIKKIILKEFESFTNDYPSWIIHIALGIISGMLLSFIFNKYGKIIFYLMTSFILIFFLSFHLHIIIIDYKTISKLCGFPCQNHHEFFNYFLKIINFYKIYFLTMTTTFFIFFKGFSSFKKSS